MVTGTDFVTKTPQSHKLVTSSFQTDDLCTFPRCISRSVLKVHLADIGEFRVFYRFGAFTIRRCVVS